MSEQFLSSNPILPVTSVVETQRFYETELGFSTDVLWQEPRYAVMKRDSAYIEFGEGRKQHAGTGVCFIQVDDADRVYTEWQQKQVEFVGDLADRDYGSRDFRVRDNNGNMLIVGHQLIE